MVQSEDGMDELDVLRIGAGLADGRDVLRRPVDLGEAVHEVDPRQPLGAVHVRLQALSASMILWARSWISEYFSICGASPTVNRAGRSAASACSARMPPIPNLILMLFLGE